MGHRIGCVPHQIEESAITSAHASVGECPSSDQLLSLRAGGRHCALPLSMVVEVLRPLPVEALRDTPDFLLGMSVLRGRPVPVLDLARLLGDAHSEAGRWLHLRLGDRPLALAVDSVDGVQRFEQVEWQRLPTLFDQAEPAPSVARLAELDHQLLTQLDAMRLLLWQRLPGNG